MDESRTRELRAAYFQREMEWERRALAFLSSYPESASDAEFLAMKRRSLRSSLCPEDELLVKPASLRTEVKSAMKLALERHTRVEVKDKRVMAFLDQVWLFSWERMKQSGLYGGIDSIPHVWLNDDLEFSYYRQVSVKRIFGLGSRSTYAMKALTPYWVVFSEPMTRELTRLSWDAT